MEETPPNPPQTLEEQPNEAAEDQSRRIGPDIIDLSTISLPGPSTEVSMNDPLFPFSKSFNAKSRREKEQLFMKAFEDQVNFVRTKELKADNSLGKPLPTQEAINTLNVNRSKFIEQNENKNVKKLLMQKETIFSSDPAPRVNVTTQPTFDPLLNINYESQYTLMDKFKEVISEILIQNRAKTRSQRVLQRLLVSQGAQQPSPQEPTDSALTSAGKTTTTAETLLTLSLKVIKRPLKFSQQSEPIVPDAPSVPLEPNKIEKQVQFYKPGLVERYQLSPFERTDTGAFLPIPIAPPSTYPTVTEEQPVRERAEPILPEDSTVNPLASRDISTVLPLPQAYNYPRDIRFFDFDPVFSLRAMPTELPPMENQIGQASILAMPLSDYQGMFLTHKSSVPVAPFTFLGFSKQKLPQMSGPDPVDMRELEADDDIDNLDVHPKARPASDFIIKPTAQTNKSHAIGKQVVDSQTKWKERQRDGIKKLNEKLTAVNQLMRDKTLELSTDDLQSF